MELDIDTDKRCKRDVSALASPLALKIDSGNPCSPLLRYHLIAVTHCSFSFIPNHKGFAPKNCLG